MTAAWTHHFGRAWACTAIACALLVGQQGCGGESPGTPGEAGADAVADIASVDSSVLTEVAQPDVVEPDVTVEEVAEEPDAASPDDVDTSGEAEVASGCVDGDPCDDGDLCTEGDTCAGGVCVGGGTVACEDDNVCTDDSCDPASGCVFEALTGADCDDGNACSAETTCQDGVCLGEAISCDDEDPCTSDACEPDSGCIHEPVWLVACEDGDLCTVGDTCEEGVCIPGEMPCEVDDPCLLAACDAETGACGAIPVEDGLPCPVADACESEATCQAGVCVGVSAVCDDDNPCTANSCDGQNGCVFTPTEAGCDDGDPCTLGDVCSESACVPGAPIVCDDEDLCTADSCDVSTGECLHEVAPADGTVCDDGNPCTPDDLCTGGLCQGGESTCDCQQDADCAPQEDGDLCNGTLRCDVEAFPHVCVLDLATVVTCDQSGDTACTATTCVAESGECVTGPAHEGEPCDDQSACTVGDACEAGLCAPGEALNCDDANPCTDDDCLAESGCDWTPNEAPCDADGNGCTADDQCADGVCKAGEDVVCEDDDEPCTSPACDPATGACVFEALTDGLECTSDTDVCTLETCAEGLCTVTGVLSCPDDNPCGNPYCDPESGCTTLANNAACDDEDACTDGDTCASFACVSGPPTVCDDGDPCTEATCDADDGCEYEAVYDGVTCVPDPATWTLLVYMAADNNLEGAALEDIEELLEIPGSADLHIAVQVDRAPGYSASSLSGVGSWESTKRLEIQDGEVIEWEDLGETNTGEPEVLADFIAWGLSTFPADRTMLVLWNHGNAWHGYGGDGSTEDTDHLDVTEIAQGVADGLSEAGLERFDLLGFDACLMADLAAIRAMAPYGDYLLVSEDFEPGNGWDYELFEEIVDNPSILVRTLGQELVDGFRAQSKENKKHHSITLALMDTDELPAVEAALSDLLTAMSDMLGDDGTAVARGRDLAQEFGRSPLPEKHFQMADLGDLATRISIQEPAVIPQKDALLQALDDLVLHRVDGKLTTDATGVAVYFPRYAEHYDAGFEEVVGMDDWRGFLTEYYATAAAEEVAPLFYLVDTDSGGTVKDVNDTCDNGLCDTALGEHPLNCAADCAAAPDFDVVGCSSPTATAECSGDYLLTCGAGEAPVWCGAGSTCGPGYGDPSAPVEALGCMTQPATAIAQCDDEGFIEVGALLDEETAQKTASASLTVGYMNHEDETIQLYGRIPAEVTTNAISGKWRQRVLTVRQGTYQAPLFAHSTEDDTLAHHEVPLRYTPASAWPCAPATCPTRPAVWHVTTNIQLNTTVAHALYLQSAEGLSEITLEPGDRLEPMIQSGTLDGPFFWKPAKPLVLDPSEPLHFSFDNLSAVLEYDEHGEPVQAIDGTAASLVQKLHYTRIYLELTADNIRGDGSRVYWLGPTDDCPVAPYNWCGDPNLIPDCTGACVGVSHLQNGRCDDGQAADGETTADLNCFQHTFDNGECPSPACPVGADMGGNASSWVMLQDAILLAEAAGVTLLFGGEVDPNNLKAIPIGPYERDCDNQCLGNRAIYKALIYSGNLCLDGSGPLEPNFNCAQFSWSESGCKCGDNCSGHGTCLDKQGQPVDPGDPKASACTCDDGYWGSRCEYAPTCGDDTCDDTSETCFTCPVDCGGCTNPCGDGQCVEAQGETCASCPLDCGACSCGDGQCTAGLEDCASCFSDCGTCPKCGDGTCTRWYPGAPFDVVQSEDTGEWHGLHEHCGNCPQDCGACEGCCCGPHPGQGCDNPEIAECVCRYEPSCCDGIWGQRCLAIAQRRCGVCSVEEGYADAAALGDGLCTGVDEDQGFPAGSSPDCQELAVESVSDLADGDFDGVDNAEADEALCTGGQLALCGDNCLAEFNPLQLDHDWDGVGDACDPDRDGDGVFEGLGNDPCVGGEQPADTGCDDNCPEVYNPGQADTDEDGVGDACGESFCGDGLCAGEPESPSNCCAANPGQTGCGDPAVEACVCARDAACCADSWSSACVQLASTCSGLCGETPATCPQDCCTTGSCCRAGAAPGCASNPVVENCVCALEPACCEAPWTTACATVATDQCGLSCAAGDCCLANGTPGCEDEDLQGCVCEADPACCDGAWEWRCARYLGECTEGQAELSGGPLPYGVCNGKDLQACIVNEAPEPGGVLPPGPIGGPIGELSLNTWKGAHCSEGGNIGLCDGSVLTVETGAGGGCLGHSLWWCDAGAPEVENCAEEEQICEMVACSQPLCEADVAACVEPD